MLPLDIDIDNSQKTPWLDDMTFPSCAVSFTYLQFCRRNVMFWGDCIEMVCKLYFTHSVNDGEWTVCHIGSDEGDVKQLVYCLSIIVFNYVYSSQ